MRIGHIAPINFNIPNGRSGPLRVFVDLNKGLSKYSDIDLNVFACENSKTEGNLKFLFDKELNSLPEFNNSEKIDKGLFFLKHIAHAYQYRGEIDLFTSHLAKWTLPIASLVDSKSVLIVHNITDNLLSQIEKFNNNNIHFVCLSQAIGNIFSNYAENYSVIHNGIDVKEFSPNYNKQDYFLFVGRLVKSKSPDLAIRACIENNQKLVLIGKPVTERSEELKYFETEIEPYLKNPLITYFPEIPHNEINSYYQNAKALIFPMRDFTREGMPLVVAESLASGTPIISLDNDLSRELIDEKTGFLAKDENDLVKNLLSIQAADPKSCRIRAEKYLSLEVMAEKYYQLYKTILKT